MNALTGFQSARRDARGRPGVAAAPFDSPPHSVATPPIARERGRPPAVAAFLGAIDRLEEVVDRETELLSEHRPLDLRESNQRKSQGLLELSRAIRTLADIEPGDVVARRVEAFRIKLEANQRLLQTHLRAMQEVLAIVSEAIEVALSDGTYSARVGVKDWQR